MSKKDTHISLESQIVLQAMWEGPLAGEQRVRVSWCYAPSDIPSEVATPEASGVREVYESNHSDDNPVGSILGPCLLLPQQVSTLLMVGD